MRLMVHISTPCVGVYLLLLVVGRPDPIFALQTECDLDPVTSPLLKQNRTCPPPVDDSSQEQKGNYPWTETVNCLFPRSIGSKQKFCVYSSSAFNGNAGISIISTPEVAASISDAVRGPIPAWHGRRHLAHHGRLQPEHEFSLPYTVVSIPGKGKGVVATRRIAQFDTIMLSFPAMIVDNEFLPGEEDEAPVEGRRLFQQALDQLVDGERFVDLAKSKGGDVHVVENVVRTNAFGITVIGRDLKALYPEIARFNHGCDPNAFPRFTAKDLAMKAVATREILPGEEITISYIPLGMPTEYRTRYLSNWGFNCTCPLCSSPPEVRRASDDRRERLAELYFAMQEPSAKYEQVVELTRDFLELVEVERLVTKMAEYYQAFMRIYYNFGKTSKAQEFAQIGLKYCEAFSDPDGGFCVGLRQDLRFLEGLAEKKRTGGG